MQSLDNYHIYGVKEIRTFFFNTPKHLTNQTSDILTITYSRFSFIQAKQ